MAVHKDLEVWKQTIKLTIAVFELRASFPASETYGLVSQMRRSAVSIPSNISEGAARDSDKEFIRFLYIALGSIAQLDTQYTLSPGNSTYGGIRKGREGHGLRRKDGNGPDQVSKA